MKLFLTLTLLLNIAFTQSAQQAANDNGGAQYVPQENEVSSEFQDKPEEDSFILAVQEQYNFLKAFLENDFKALDELLTNNPNLIHQEYTDLQRPFRSNAIMQPDTGYSLINAVDRNDYDMASYLLDKGANPNIGVCRSPLSYVKTFKMALLLLFYGANPALQKDEKLPINTIEGRFMCRMIGLGEFNKIEKLFKIWPMACDKILQLLNFLPQYKEQFKKIYFKALENFHKSAFTDPKALVLEYLGDQDLPKEKVLDSFDKVPEPALIPHYAQMNWVMKALPPEAEWPGRYSVPANAPALIAAPVVAAAAPAPAVVHHGGAAFEVVEQKEQAKSKPVDKKKKNDNCIIS